MYQLAFSLTDGLDANAALDALRQRIARSEHPHATVLFHVLNASPDYGLDDQVVDAIRTHFPDAPYLGCSSNANIVDGEITQGERAVSVICDVFEDPDTSVELIQLPLDYDCQEQTAQALLDALAARPDVKIVEIMNTVETANMPRFCSRVSEADERVVMFGGGALNWVADFYDVVVFSSVGEKTESGVVFALYSGTNLHAHAELVQGWKPLGMPFRITRAERMTLYELNGKPALDTYNHYLQFSDDDSFLENGLCFPLCIECDGEQVMRTPIAKGEDGSIIMPTDISEVSEECRVAYGDPLAIRQDVQECTKRIQAFGPQAILSFACVARLLYWGHDYAALETRPLSQVAPVAGFYTGGELVRKGRALVHHNLALVLVGLREGTRAKDVPRYDAPEARPLDLSLQLSLIGHMASFIGAAADELQTAYERMDALARTDGLTGLANRSEVEETIWRVVEGFAATVPQQGHEDESAAPALVMLDLDNFKHVNDTFGHQAGDEVLRRLATLVREAVARQGGQTLAGRWGGEEFMVLLPCVTLSDATTFAERLRQSLADLDFGELGTRTMSVGVAQLREGDTPDALCTRVDQLLYAAKEQGKNRVVADAR